MKRALVATVVIVALLVLTGIIVTVIGSQLPQNHVATRAMRFNRGPADVYAAIHDFASYPAWREDVSRVEMLGIADGRLQFREHSSQGAVTYEVVENIPNEKLVTRIVDRDLGYSGSWTYLITLADDGTTLQITENGEVTNPLFRFLSRYVFGHTSMIERYLAALDRHLRV